MMKIIFTVMVLSAGVGVGVYLALTIAKNRNRHPQRSAAWEKAQGETNGIVGQRIVVQLARPFSSLPSVYDENSKLYRAVQQRLVQAGGMFASSPEVFLSVQALGCVLAGTLLLLGFAGVLPVFLTIPAALLCAITPYARLDSASKRQAVAVSKSLPEYAELLQIPIGAGMSVMASLAFLSSTDPDERRIHGVVSDEVAGMLSAIRAHALSEDEAFILAGERLGTSEAKTFFNTLLQAHLRGSKLSENIAKQAASLRAAEFQRMRAEAKRIPVRLVVVFAIFFLPFLFSIVLMPVLNSLQSLT